MNITVYLGSSIGNNPMYAEAAAALGDWIGINHHTLVYGGAGVGMMRILADHVHKHHGYIIGVMPEFMIETGRGYDTLDQQIRTRTMSARKAIMIELGDAFIAMPGGPGTLEEISEVISLIRLKQKMAPCVILNLNGYYDDLRQQFAKMVSAGFLQESESHLIHFADHLEEAEHLLTE
ncbi:MAG: TIGR00730 family Rossman fold protein [Erysipelotrichia bacterium]|nr:TIGR00730 family Rossman fold protein [Erysipelotrichia bacterium]